MPRAEDGRDERLNGDIVDWGLFEEEAIPERPEERCCDAAGVVAGWQLAA